MVLGPGNSCVPRALSRDCLEALQVAIRVLDAIGTAPEKHQELEPIKNIESLEEKNRGSQ